MDFIMSLYILRLLHRNREGMSLTEIYKHVFRNYSSRTTFETVRKHVLTLEKIGLVKTEHKGRERVATLTENASMSRIDWAYRLFTRFEKTYFEIFKKGASHEKGNDS